MTTRSVIPLGLAVAAGLLLAGCGRVQAQGDSALDGSPPAPKVAPVQDASLFTVDHPEQFPLATALAHRAAFELVVTGTVTPDVSRNVPVVSLASGRVVAVHARFGDTVRKGQSLLTIRSDDISGGYANYRKAVTDEALARTQLERAEEMYRLGAMALKDLEVARDTEDKARVDVETMAEHLRLLGDDPEKPHSVVEIPAPASGVITDQQVTNGAGVQALSTPGLFTISDLTSVWVLCDVYENDLANVQVGDSAEIQLNAYPDRVFTGKVGNIGAILDPNLRTAKVRIEIHNPGIMRLGMFVTATFRDHRVETHALVPAAAIVHMHDRDFVFVPAENRQFRRVEVVAGDLVPGDTSQQEIRSGIRPGQQVVANALVLDHVLGE